MSNGQKTGLANITESAKFLGISDNSVRKLISDGKLPHELIGSHRRIPWSALYDFAPPLPEKSAPINLKDSSKSRIEKSLERIEAEISSIRAMLKTDGKGRWK